MSIQLELNTWPFNSVQLNAWVEQIAAKSSSLYQLDREHWNVTGHKVAAQIIVKYLEQNIFRSTPQSQR